MGYWVIPGSQFALNNKKYIWTISIGAKTKIWKKRYCLARILKSYIKARYFQVKIRTLITSFRSIISGVPQGHLLYLLYIANLFSTSNTTPATFVNDTFILSSQRSAKSLTNTTRDYRHHSILS